MVVAAGKKDAVIENRFNATKMMSNKSFWTQITQIFTNFIIINFVILRNKINYDLYEFAVICVICVLLFLIGIFQLFFWFKALVEQFGNFGCNIVSFVGKQDIITRSITENHFVFFVFVVLFQKRINRIA